jgi:urea transporter
VTFDGLAVVARWVQILALAGLAITFAVSGVYWAAVADALAAAFCLAAELHARRLERRRDRWRGAHDALVAERGRREGRHS